MVLLWFLLLCVALFVLLKSAEYFVNIATLLGKRFNVPSFIIGATLVAFGTSLPELAVGVSSVLSNQSDIVVGTVIGSNISNIFFILGIGILIAPNFTFNIKQLKIELLLLVVSAILVVYFMWDGLVVLWESLVLIVGLLIYLIYVIKYGNSEDNEEHESASISTKQYALFAASIFGIWVGAKFTTDSISKISEILQLGSSVISQTVVALGTSLPELAVTIVAARKSQTGIILGNVIGSNIFNAFTVIGIPAVVGVISHHPFEIMDASFNNFSSPLMLFASFLLIISAFFKPTPKLFGVLFVLLYIFYLVGSFSNINLLQLFF